MYKVLVDSSGLIKQVHSPMTYESYPHGSQNAYGLTYLDYEGESIARHTHYWDFATETWCTLPEQPAHWYDWNSEVKQWEENISKKLGYQANVVKEIQKYWNDTTQVSITVAGSQYHSFDIDIQKMIRAYENWDYITKVDGNIIWRDYNNNDHSLTKEEFNTLILEIKKAKAIAIDKIYNYANQLKQLLPVEENHSGLVKENWPTLAGFTP